MSKLISVSSLNKKYGDHQIVKDISLEVNEGQIFGLVGPNGAGKTTCLQAMLGLISFDGEVQIAGHNPKKQRENMLTDVAYIADVAVLPKWLRVDQALEYMQAVHPRFNLKKAKGFLAKTNIKFTAKVKTLSKGMVTQLHLALILALDVKVLILDEPTLGLDLLTRRQFYSHLLEDFYDDNKCILVTTHQIEEIEHMLTDIAFIKNGELVMQESVDEIKNRYQLVTVGNEKVAEAQALNPLYTTRVMGLTSMLFKDFSKTTLEALGSVASPTLADIFVGVMSQEQN